MSRAVPWRRRTIGARRATAVSGRSGRPSRRRGSRPAPHVQDRPRLAGAGEDGRGPRDRRAGGRGGDDGRVAASAPRPPRGMEGVARAAAAPVDPVAGGDLGVARRRGRRRRAARALRCDASRAGPPRPRRGERRAAAVGDRTRGLCTGRRPDKYRVPACAPIARHPPSAAPGPRDPAVLGRARLGVLAPAPRRPRPRARRRARRDRDDGRGCRRPRGRARGVRPGVRARAAPHRQPRRAPRPRDDEPPLGEAELDPQQQHGAGGADGPLPRHPRRGPARGGLHGDRGEDVVARRRRGPAPPLDARVPRPRGRPRGGPVREAGRRGRLARGPRAPARVFPARRLGPQLRRLLQVPHGDVVRAPGVRRRDPRVPARVHRRRPRPHRRDRRPHERHPPAPVRPPREGARATDPLVARVEAALARYPDRGAT